MDEELAGEVFWQGLYERSGPCGNRRESGGRSRDKIQRIKKRARQKTLGKYIKPPPDDTARSNHTLTVDL